MSGWMGGWTSGWVGAAASAAETGIVAVDDWADLPTATGSGDEYIVRACGLVVTDCEIEGAYQWLPSEAVRRSDGTLYTTAWARDAADNPCKIFPGDSYPGTWTLSGTCTTTGGKVTISGYLYAAVASTAARVLVVVQYRALPDGSVSEAGVAGGSVVGGTGRWLNTRLTPAGAVTMGLYQTSVSAGTLAGQAGLPVFGLLDQTSVTSVVRAYSAGGAPGTVAMTDRTQMDASGAYFQIMSVDSGGSGVSLELDYAGLITLT